jgi:hypothetical protein
LKVKVSSSEVVTTLLDLFVDLRVAIDVTCSLGIVIRDENIVFLVSDNMSDAMVIVC